MQTIKEMYRGFVIRDPEEHAAHPLDVQQRRRAPGRPPLRVRVGRALVLVGQRLATERPSRDPELASCSTGELR